jgi:hypothetical protein
MGIVVVKLGRRRHPGAPYGECSEVGEAGNAGRSMLAVSGTELSIAAEPSLEVPGRLIGKTIPAGMRRCRTVVSARMPAGAS